MTGPQGNTGPQGIQGIQGVPGPQGVPGDSVPQVMNRQTGTSYTLVLSDAWKKIICDNAAPFSLIIPINSAVPFAIGTRVDVYQANFGQVTISSAATLRYPIGPKIKGIYGEVGLTKIGNDEWIISGYISA